ncbi:MAG: hypothetical protein KC656_20500, partial [Myxococcales bacterium]|nr:hypothetical protein [Myxococcales bacterium]
VFTTSSVLDRTDLQPGVVAGMQSLESAFFRPNILFLDIGLGSRDAEIEHLWREARRVHMGLAMLASHPRAGLGRRTVLHLWLDAELTALPVEQALDTGRMHLAVLMALRLARTWKGELTLYALCEGEDDLTATRTWLRDLFDRARIPRAVGREVLVGDLDTCLERAPQSDLDLLRLPAEVDVAVLRRRVELSRSACLFFADSGQEDALA